MTFILQKVIRAQNKYAKLVGYLLKIVTILLQTVRDSLIENVLTYWALFRHILEWVGIWSVTGDHYFGLHYCHVCMCIPESLNNAMHCMYTGYLGNEL